MISPGRIVPVGSRPVGSNGSQALWVGESRATIGTARALLDMAFEEC